VGERFTIVGVGEALWDVFEGGKVLGGAPTNFAYHVCGLGHEGIPLSRVGQDRLGNELLGAICQLGMPTRYIQRDPGHPTSTVIVKLAADGTPDFTIVEDVAWDFLEPDERWLELARGADAVCFGTLAQRSATSRRTIQQLLAAAESALKVCDINFRQRYYSREVVTESLATAHVLKLNESELDELRRVLGYRSAARDAGDEFARHLMAEYGLEMVCITLGGAGCRLVAPGEAVSRPVPATRVVDTVGSGDAFTAGLVVKRLEGRSLASVAEAANLLGAYVAGFRGATPPLDEEVRRRFEAI